MNLTIAKDQAVKHDRFYTDVNALLKRFRKAVPSMKKLKIRGKETFSDLYIFWYKDDNDTIWYVA